MLYYLYAFVPIKVDLTFESLNKDYKYKEIKFLLNYIKRWLYPVKQEYYVAYITNCARLGDLQRASSYIYNMKKEEDGGEKEKEKMETEDIYMHECEYSNKDNNICIEYPSKKIKEKKEEGFCMNKIMSVCIEGQSRDQNQKFKNIFLQKRKKKKRKFK